MKNINLNSNIISTKLLIFIAYYLVFLTAFYLNEDSNGGAYQDYLGYKNIINLFLEDFKLTLLTFDELGERHSPIIIILLTLFYKFGITDELIRFVFFNFSIISCIFFYKCLKLRFKDVSKNYLYIFSLIFFLSPTFRSLSVWPDSRILGFHFFVISVYFFLKYFNYKKNILYCYLNIFFLALSSYVSINFCVFGLYFFYHFYYELIKNKKLLNYLLINIFFAFPAFYYLFILKVFFINTGLTPGNEINSFGILNSFNYSNKILIISSLIFFYFLPLLFYFRKKILDYKFSILEFFLLSSFIIINIFLFNYKIEFTGGGIFFKGSNIIFGGNLIFYLISFISIFLVYILFNARNNYNNLIILILIMLSNPQLSIYHKYYDPLLIFLFFTLFEFKINKNFFTTGNIILMNLFYLTFLVLNFIK